jgi:hypothetical protein
MRMLIYMFLLETKKLPMEQVCRSHWLWKKIVGEVEDKEDDEKEQPGAKLPCRAPSTS